MIAKLNHEDCMWNFETDGATREIHSNIRGNSDVYTLTPLWYDANDPDGICDWYKL